MATFINPPLAAASRHDARYLVPLFLLVAFAVISVLSSFGAAGGMSTAAVGSICCCAVLGVIIQGDIFTRGTRVDLDLMKPETVFGMFYFIYFAIPIILLALGFAPMVEDQLEISMMMLVGFIAFKAGSGLGNYDGRGRRIRPRSSGLDGPTSIQWMALMATATCCALFVAYATLKSIDAGLFYSHASTENRAFVADSDLFLMVAASSMEFPIILILGMAVACKTPSLSRYAFGALCGYTGFMMLMWVFSSQFRPAFSGSILFILALRIGNRLEIRLKHMLVAFFLSIVCFGLIRGARELNGVYMRGTSNQLTESVKMTQQTVNKNLFQYLLSEQTAQRAAGNLYLLSEVRSSVDKGYDFVYGAMLTSSLYGLVPRLLWKEKPVFEPFQTQLRRHFGLRVQDDPAGPLLYFYANAGWVGVIAGFAFMGFAFRRFGLFVGDVARVGPWILFAFAWSAFIQVEQEIVLLILLSLRTGLCILMLYYGLLAVAGLLTRNHRQSETQQFGRFVVRENGKVS